MIKKRILYWLLPKLLEKKSGDTIPRSGEAGKKVNCYTIYLLGEDGEPSHLVDSINLQNSEISVRSLDDNNTFSINNTIGMGDVSSNQIEVTHYYGLYSLKYKSIFSLAINYITKYDACRVQLSIFRNYISQSFFNQKNLEKKLVTKTRIGLLYDIVAIQLRQHSETNHWIKPQGIHHVPLMCELYTDRYIQHPDTRRISYAVSLYLDSLVQSDELKKEDNKYIATGKAIETLEKYEENERRHNAAVGIQKKIFWLTVIIALAAMIEAELINLPPLIDWPFIKPLLNSFSSLFSIDL